MQSRLGSALEAFANVGIGFSVSVVANMLVLPAWGFEVSASDALGMGAVFTVVSLVRSYLVRRAFNRWSGRA